MSIIRPVHQHNLLDLGSGPQIAAGLHAGLSLVVGVVIDDYFVVNGMRGVKLEVFLVSARPAVPGVFWMRWLAATQE